MKSVTASQQRTRARIEALGPWFHNLHLPDGTQTCPNHALGDFPSFKWQALAPHLPEDLTGWSCLDVGCNAGFYSFEMARRGADVLGIDLDPRYLRQAAWAADLFGLTHRVRFERKQVYDLAGSSESFDLVLFMGVLYHLRYPMLGLDIVCQKARKLMVLQSLSMPGEEVFEAGLDYGLDERDVMLSPGWPMLAFIEHRFMGDPTNWWAPNHAAIEAMLRTAGMRIDARPAHETYICIPNPSRPSAMTTWNNAEFRSATGQKW